MSISPKLCYLACFVALVTVAAGCRPPRQEERPCTFVGELEREPTEAQLAVVAAAARAPLLISDGVVWACPCARPRRLAGATEGRRLGGQTEARRLGGETEARRLGGETEARRLGGETEDRRLGGETEDRRLGGETEDRRLGGETEDRRLGGETEDRRLGGETEDRRLGGETEARRLGGETEARRLGGETEARRLGGDTADLRVTCAPDLPCGGFGVRGLSGFVRVYSREGGLARSSTACVRPW